MGDLLGLRDELLEIAGERVLIRMGLNCVYPLLQVRLLDFDPVGSHAEGDHLEFDYLIPINEYCLVGEITGRGIDRSVRDKYRRFRSHLNLIRNMDFNDAFWRTLGVPDNRLREFRYVRHLLGFFLTTRLEEHDLNLDSVPQINRFYRSDCALFEEYSECIGSYSRNHFLQIFDIPGERGQRPLEINRENHDLIFSTDKHIVSGDDVPRADIYTFEVNPYYILPFAHVYRRDELPQLASNDDLYFQRPLISTKISEIRRKLLTNPDFMFPNSILAILSSECRYDEEAQSLRIPQTYESISIIDGQHRLFSYANDEIQEILENNSRIIITAILFEGASQEEISMYSAKAFVEINRNQTGIQRKHLDAIAYDLLEETDGRAIAAKILLETNKRRGHCLYGLFETNKRIMGVLKATTIISALRPLTNKKIFEGLIRVREGSSRFLLRQGYLNLFGVENIDDLSNPETLIEQGIVSVEHFFNLVKDTFRNDWPEPGLRENSSLQFAKMVAGFVRLFRQFVSEGATWEDIRRELELIRDNILLLRGIDEYEGILFDPTHPAIPDSVPRDTDDFHFLNSNRQNCTSIEEVMRRRHQ